MPIPDTLNPSAAISNAWNAENSLPKADEYFIQETNRIYPTFNAAVAAANNAGVNLIKEGIAIEVANIAVWKKAAKVSMTHTAKYDVEVELYG